MERQRVNPSLSALLKITSVLEIDPGFLFGEEAHSNNPVQIVRKNERLTVVFPGANINYEQGVAVFEPTHGTAPKYTGLDRVNPSAMVLSGVMLLNHIGWKEAGKLITGSLEATIMRKTVTYDLARKMKGSKLLKCSEFGDAIIMNMQAKMSRNSSC